MSQQHSWPQPSKRQRLVSAINYLGMISHAQKTTRLEALVRAAYLRYRYGLIYKQAGYYGLLGKGNPLSAGAQILPYQRYKDLLFTINPKDTNAINDKIRFAHLCSEQGLRAPALIAYCDTIGSVNIAVNREVTMEQLGDHLNERDLQSMVYKPAMDDSGSNILFLVKAEGNPSGSVWVDQFSSEYRLADLYQLLIKRRALLQTPVENHPSLKKISHAEGLQTCRIVTLAKADKEPIIYAAFYKIIASSLQTDNHCAGMSGNLSAPIDIETGTLRAGRRCHYLDRHANHPITDNPITGVVIPDWDECLDYVKKAARAVLPMGTVGWDIALTEDGPVLIEGNVWSSPCNNCELFFTRADEQNYIDYFEISEKQYRAMA